MKISEHITIEEATHSATADRFGIKNEPTSDILNNMVLVAIKCFEPLRLWYNKPIKVDSFYRCQELNSKVGGAKNSQHVDGKAIDMNAGSKEENGKLFNWCKDNLEYDQLIWEYGDDSGPDWVHISFNLSHNRKQIVIVK